MLNNNHSLLHITHLCVVFIFTTFWGRRGRDCIVVEFITTYAISAYHHYCYEFESRSGEVYPLQHYVIKHFSDLRHVGGFLWVLRFPPSIKLIASI